MLEKLDDIDWGSLTHAYGPATDVPQMLRGLLTAEGEEREYVWDDLWTTIWHQGTVYEATAYAVPFLVELLPHVPDPWGILYFLSRVAQGNSYLEVHGPMPGHDEERDGAEFREQLGKEMSWVRAAHEAVYVHHHTYLDLLATGDPDTQITAANLLCRFPEYGDLLAPPIITRIRVEETPAVKAALLIALAYLNDAETALLAEHLATTQPLVVRLGAALGLAYVLEVAVPDEAVMVLVQALRDAQALQEEQKLLSWIVGDIQVAASGVLAMVGFERVECYVPDIIALLETSTWADNEALVGVILALVFGQGKLMPRSTADDLNPLQRLALEKILEHALVIDVEDDQPAINGNVAGVLVAYGVPNRPEDLRRFLAR